MYGSACHCLSVYLHWLVFLLSSCHFSSAWVWEGCMDRLQWQKGMFFCTRYTCITRAVLTVCLCVCVRGRAGADLVEHGVAASLTPLEQSPSVLVIQPTMLFFFISNSGVMYSSTITVVSALVCFLAAWLQYTQHLCMWACMEMRADSSVQLRMNRLSWKQRGEWRMCMQMSACRPQRAETASAAACSLCYHRVFVILQTSSFTLDEFNTLLLHLCLTTTLTGLCMWCGCSLMHTALPTADTQQPSCIWSFCVYVWVLLVSDWCVRTDKDLSSVNTFFPPSIFVGDTQAQEDVGVYLSNKPQEIILP